MANSFSFTLNVPPLPDIGIWFANAAAWTSYWQQAISVTFTPISNAVYVDIPVGAATYYDFLMDLNGDGIDEHNVVPSKESFDLLVANYKNLRQAMKDAGLITQSQ